MKRKNNRYIFLGAAAVVVVAASLLVIFVIGRSSPGSGQNWVQQNIEEYRGTLAVATDPTQRAFVQDKLNRVEQIETNRLLALTNVPPKPEDPCALRPTPKPTRLPEHIPGIKPLTKAAPNPDGFMPTTQWEGEWIGLWVRVYAGYNADGPSQGVVQVSVENTADFNSYDAPTRGGALTITSADGLVLTLRDASGAALYFDVASRQYVSSPASLAATFVPMPTFTPDIGSCPADTQ